MRILKLFYWNVIKLQQLSRCCINADDCYKMLIKIDKSTDRVSTNRVLLVWKTSVQVKK